MGRIWGFIGLILGLLSGGTVYSQEEKYVFHHLRVEDGLTQATNAFIYKDTRGFVWISSITGLNRFDGISVRQYTPDITDPGSLIGENIQSEFFEDDAGNIWFCTYEAIHRYDWKQDCFDHFQVRDEKDAPLIGYYVFHLDRLQQLWFVLDNQEVYTLHLPTGQFQFICQVPPLTLRCFVEPGHDGRVERIYLRGQNWTGLRVLEMREAGQPEATIFLPQFPELGESTVKRVIPSGDSLVWVLTTRALMQYTTPDEAIMVREIPDAEEMVQVSDSTLLIGTQSSGLWMFNTRTWQFEFNHTHDPRSTTSILSNNVKYLYCDVDGTIWVSSERVGLSYASPLKRKFSTTYLPMQSDPEREIHPMDFGIEGPGHLVCFSRLDGVLDIWHRPDKIQIQQVRRTQNPFPREVYWVKKYRNEPYWVATWNGIYLYDHGNQYLRQITNDTLKAYSLTPLPGQKMLFAGTKGGVFEMQAGTRLPFAIKPWQKFSSPDEYLPVWADHQGRIWGNRNLQEFVVVDSLGLNELARIPVPGNCYSMVLSPDSTTYWVAGTRGLFRIAAASLELIRKYDDKDGLPAAGINSMLMDRTGGLWLAHSNGIIFFNPATEEIRYYGVDDGLPSLEFTQASCQLDNGEMWFGAVGSLTRFIPEQVQDIRIKAIPQITRLLLYDREPDIPLTCEQTGATQITDIKELCLDYKHNTLTFTLNALEYSAPSRNNVMYTMEGLDDGFIHTKNGSQIRYPNMPPGDYRLVVYASNSDGVQNPEPRMLEITILPPFYKTWWFYTLVALAAISVIAYIIYLRFSKALDLQKVRLRLYENLHDDVGSRLTAIVLSAEDLERNEKINNPKLQSIAQIARGIVGNMRRLVWAIDPENDRMNSIIQKINHDSSVILGDYIEFQLDVDPGLRQLVVPGEIRYQMSSISSEAFNNIAKYAEATRVDVRIARENHFIKLTITDNGKGFDPELKGKSALTGSGYGLGNMQKRAARVGGTFHLYSRPGDGTRVEFTFPFRR